MTIASAMRSRWPALLVPGLLLVVGSMLLVQPAQSIDADDREAIARALRALTGQRNIDARYVCGRAARSFPGVVVLGGFAHDRGCAIEGVMVLDRPLDPQRGTAVALARAGWRAAAPAERDRLALAWTREVLLAFHHSLDQPTEHFARPGTPAFAPPAATPLPDGGVRVVLWIQGPNGMLPQTSYARVAYTYAADGNLVAREESERFRTPLGR